MNVGHVLNPLVWLPLMVIGHTTIHWLFWLGLVIAVVYAIFTAMTVKALARIARERGVTRDDIRKALR